MKKKQRNASTIDTIDFLKHFHQSLPKDNRSLKTSWRILHSKLQLVQPLVEPVAFKKGCMTWYPGFSRSAFQTKSGLAVEHLAVEAVRVKQLWLGFLSEICGVIMKMIQWTINLPSLIVRLMPVVLYSFLSALWALNNCPKLTNYPCSHENIQLKPSIYL